MFARLAPGSFGSSVWVANSTAIPQLLQLSIPIGTSGSHVPVMTESDGQFRILTRPVIFTEKVPALGTLGDIGLYDFSHNVVGLRADFSLAKSSHLGSASDTRIPAGSSEWTVSRSEASRSRRTTATRSLRSWCFKRGHSETRGDGTPFLRFWREIGIGAPDLRLHRAQLRAFTEADWLELRDDYGATEEMILKLRRLAADVTDDRTCG